MSEALIVFNAGSTSVKFGAYEVAGKGIFTLGRFERSRAQGSSC